MTKIELVRGEMVKAMKEHDAPRKEALSMLLSALKAKEKDKREPLTEEEENAVIKKEIKQTRETLESAPADRADIRQEAEFRIGVLSQFAPEEMGEEAIRAVIAEVLAEMGVKTPDPKQKGLIMKNLMPRVKGKADGGLVNRLVGELFA